MSEIDEINGVSVVFNKLKTSKTVRVESYINQGCFNESLDNLGISHLLEHICTDGWDKCGNNTCSEYWKKKGAILNASTDSTNINYFIKGLSQYAEDMLEYILTISTTPRINDDRIKKEKKAVENELQMHSTHPHILMYDLLNKMLYNPEGLQHQDDIKGQIKVLEDITTEKLKKWSDKYYVTGNLLLIISGNFSRKKIKKIIHDKTKKLKKTQVQSTYYGIFKPGVDVQYIKNKDVPNTTFFFTFHCPIFYTDKEVHYIDFFSKFVNSESSSLLMYELREINKLIYNISIDYHTTAYGTYFLIETQTSKNNKIEDIITITLKVLHKLLNGDFKSQRLEWAKKAFETDHYERCNNNSYYASFYGQQYIHQLYNIQEARILNPAQVLNSVKKVNKLQFVAFIKKLIIFANMKIVYMGPREVKNLLSLVLRKI
jgi:predicted Zn-dependent peptidase